MATTEKTNLVTESFEALFEESMAQKEMRQGEIISAEVISVENDFVIVNAGLKSESIIKTEEFLDAKGDIEVNLGDHVKVAIEKIEDGYLQHNSCTLGLKKYACLQLSASHQVLRLLAEAREQS